MDFLKALSRLRSTDGFEGPAPMRAEQAAAQGPSTHPAPSVLSAPPAAARTPCGMEGVAANGDLADVACTPDLEAQLDKSIAGSTVGPICRICLSAGRAGTDQALRLCWHHGLHTCSMPDGLGAGKW